MMKKLLFLPLFFSVIAWGQNGLTTYTIPNSTTHSAVVAGPSGNLWVGTSSGIRKFNGTTWTTYDNSNTPMTANTITALGFRGTDLWAGIRQISGAGQLLEFTGTAWTDYSTSIASLPVKCIQQGMSLNEVWIGTTGGLYKFDGTNWVNYTVANSGLVSDTVNCVAFDPSGNLLVGTARGLSVENGSSWTNYTAANTPSLTSPSITSIYSDAVNGTWTWNGDLNKFSGGTFVPIRNLYATSIVSYPSALANMAKGPHGGMLTRYAGQLVEFIGNTPHCYQYPANIGMNYFSYNPADGKTWFTGISGGSPLCAFDGNNYHTVSDKPTLNTVRPLDVNQVNAAILNRGDMHWNTTSAVYEVPKGGTANTIFVSALWIGGLDNGGSLHEAAMTYRQTGKDFFPGPLDTITGTTDSTVAFQYDYLWRISKTDVLAFQYYWSTGAVQNGTYVPDNDFLTWPAVGNGNYTRDMAPFVDVNNNGIYDPLTGGDYPDIKGDQMLYCIYNDNLAPHTETGGLPMQIEIHFSAYAYSCGSVTDSLKAINYTTFYSYKIFNRSDNDYHAVHIGLFQDCDLGAYDDDFVGCYPAGNFCYAYNGDANDGSSSLPTLGTYGAHPPISSLVILDGPLATAGDSIDNDNDGTIDEPGEKNLMTGFLYYDNNFQAVGNPEAADDYYNYTSWRWKDSTDWTYGGNAYGGNTPTHFMFPSWPFETGPSVWSERSAGNIPFDRRMLPSCGPFDLPAGGMVNFEFADVFTRDTTVTPFDTMYFYNAWNDVNRVRSWYANNAAPSCVSWTVGIPEQNQPPQFSVYPNPASTQLTLDYLPKNQNATFEVIDMTGRTVMNGPIVQQGQTFIPVSALPAGIYFVRVIDGTQSAGTKFVKQ